MRNSDCCPMCRSKRLIREKKQRTDLLVNNYQERFGVDVARFFIDTELSTWHCAECDIRFHSPAIPGDSAFYDEMQEHPFYYESEKPEFRYAISKLIECGAQTVLEIGCGEGLFLNKIRNAFEIAGSELSEKSIGKLKALGIGLDEDHRVYDFVASFQVLEHVEEPEAFMKFACSKVKPGGHILVTVPNNDSVYIQEGASSILDYPPHHMTQWSRKALENMAERFSLEVVEYYREPLRPTHLLGLLSARRAQLPANRYAKYLSKKIGRVMDLISVPYHLDKVEYAGHTHGLLMKRL